MLEEELSISDNHYEDLPLPDRDPLSGFRQSLYLSYALTVISSGILILSPVSFLFIKAGVTVSLLCVALLFIQILTCRDKILRKHNQYSFHTLLYGFLLILITLSCTLFLYAHQDWENIFFHNLIGTKLPEFGTHAYLFWVFTPAFFVTAIRTYYGWSALKKDHVPFETYQKRDNNQNKSKATIILFHIFTSAAVSSVLILFCTMLAKSLMESSSAIALNIELLDASKAALSSALFFKSCINNAQPYLSYTAGCAFLIYRGLLIPGLLRRLDRTI